MVWLVRYVSYHTYQYVQVRYDVLVLMYGNIHKYGTIRYPRYQHRRWFLSKDSHPPLLLHPTYHTSRDTSYIPYNCLHHHPHPHPTLSRKLILGRLYLQHLTLFFLSSRSQRAIAPAALYQLSLCYTMVGNFKQDVFFQI